MTAHEWVVAIITASISIPFGMLAIAFYNPVERWGKRRDRGAKIKQLNALRDELREVERYKKNPDDFQRYLVARLLFISILWIGQEAVDGVIGAVTNIQYGLGYSLTGSLTAAGEAFVAAILLTIVLIIGIRAYRLYGNVRDYDKSYKSKMDKEIKRLEDETGESREAQRQSPQDEADHLPVTPA